jgi:16S rRNA (uracil1498-N3)-methyltransferase
MELFYLPELNENQTIVRLTGDEFHHLSKVLRFKVGDEIYISNGNGLIAKAKLIKISRDTCESEILEIQRFERRKTRLIALLPILRQEERFEFALEKLTELGIDEIQPFISARTVKKNFRFERSKKILITALKQSLNPFLPELKNTIEFNQFISELKSDDLVLYGDNKGLKILELQNQLTEHDVKRIIITVGPEGAFTDDELNTLKKLNSFPIWLGEFRLRSETAIISLASQLKIFSDLID